MKPNELEQNLVTAVRDVLSTMFFTEVVEEDSQPAPKNQGPFSVRVGFSGETEGELHIFVPPDTAGTLAANFLGTDPGDGLNDEQVNDVMRELTNMLCGAFLSRHDAEQQFELSSPENVPLPQPKLGDVRRALQLDNGQVELTLNWKRV